MKGKTIKLYCPSVSKLTEIITLDDQKLELGKIARIFGLEPASLKLNGHFISSGLDFVACSVTWKSLLSFFSSKGLSTGVDGSPALTVDGKISKSGTKRSHEPSYFENGVHGASSVGMNPQKEDIKSPDKKKLKESNNNELENDSQRDKCSDAGLKRKHWLENFSPFKKLKANRYSHCNSQDHEESGSGRHCTSKLGCSCLLGETMKRTREDEVLMTAPLKRVR